MKLIDLKRFETDKVLVGCCRAAELDDLNIYVKAYVNAHARKPRKVMREGKTIVVVAAAVNFENDILRKRVLYNDFPGYTPIFDIEKQIEHYLKQSGLKARITHTISQKEAAIRAGIGVWGKNALVLNEMHGTKLRLGTIITDWVPGEYPDPIQRSLCDDCYACIESCPYKALETYKVNANQCYKNYIEKDVFKLEIPLCDRCQRVCRYNK